MKGAHKLVTTRNVENIILEYSPGVGEVRRRCGEVPGSPGGRWGGAGAGDEDGRRQAEAEGRQQAGQRVQ